MLLITCNNTKENLSRESEKMNVKFHKNWENTGKILNFSCVRCNWRNLTFIFSGSNKKFSSVLLQITNYIFSL